MIPIPYTLVQADNGVSSTGFMVTGSTHRFCSGAMKPLVPAPVLCYMNDSYNMPCVHCLDISGSMFDKLTHLGLLGSSRTGLTAVAARNVVLKARPKSPDVVFISYHSKSNSE